MKVALHHTFIKAAQPGPMACHPSQEIADHVQAALVKPRELAACALPGKSKLHSVPPRGLPTFAQLAEAEMLGRGGIGGSGGIRFGLV